MWARGITCHKAHVFFLSLILFQPPGLCGIRRGSGVLVRLVPPTVCGWWIWHPLWYSVSNKRIISLSSTRKDLWFNGADSCYRHQRIILVQFRLMWPHSFLHFFIHFFILSFVRSFVRSFFLCSPIHSFIYSFMGVLRLCAFWYFCSDCVSLIVFFREKTINASVTIHNRGLPGQFPGCFFWSGALG